jgi:hypothetical protein
VSKSVKMVAVIGDEEVVVGRCHPGQARILRQAGMADWKKDRLMLKGAPGFSGSPEDVEKLLGLDSNLERQKMLKDQAIKVKKAQENMDKVWSPDRWQRVGLFGKPDGVSSKWQDALKDILGGVDAEEALNAFEEASSLKTFGVTHRCDTLLAWGMRCLELRAAGHDLYPYDDPKSLALGFVDASDGNTCYEFHLRRLKTAPDSVFETLGTTRKQLTSREGRLEFIRGGKAPEFEEPTDEEWKQLQEIFHRGAEERLRKLQEKEYRDEIMPSTAETVRAALGLKSRVRNLIDWTHVVQEQLDKEFLRYSPEEAYREFFQECRRSGHTTEMLLEAVALALQGRPVLIRSQARTMADHVVKQGLEMIKQINPAWEGFFEAWSPEKQGWKPDGMAPRIFWDQQKVEAGDDPLNSPAGLRFRATRSNPSEALREFRSYLNSLKDPDYTPALQQSALTFEEVQEVFVQGPNEDDHYLRMCHALVHLSQGGVVWFVSLESHQLRLLYPLRKQAIRMGLPLEIYGGESVPDKEPNKIRVWRENEPVEGIMLLDQTCEE